MKFETLYERYRSGTATPEEAEPVPTPVPPPTPTPAPTSTPASGADEPADEAILAAYEKAEEAWGWPWFVKSCAYMTAE